MNEYRDLTTQGQRQRQRQTSDEAGQAATRTSVTVGVGNVGNAAGPRQEYLDAFEDENYGRSRGPRGSGGGRHGRHRGRDGRDGRDEGGRERAHRGTAPGVARAAGRRGGAGAVAGDSRDGSAARRGWGRTLVGVVSAAVVTVLAVVTAGQLADPDSDAADADGVSLPSELPQPDADRGGGDEGARGPDAPASGQAEVPGPAGPAEPVLGFEELMDTTFEMAPDLTGSGELAPVPGSDPAADPSAATVVRYRVDVEEGLGLDAEFFAEAVHLTLNDPRSWGNSGERSFTRVSAGEYDWVITLASPGTTAEWCDKSGLDVRVDNVSCNSSSTERVMINAWRWAQGSETYGDDIRGYREMLINHEVGHRLGYGHVLCPGEGALAPVMMQQTKYLTTEGVTCEPNPWPHPEAAQGE
ncbi:DUF3152 domain-containing protein [Streptomyces sp. 6N223]|uniref:DUF3152 domain-containing protein n=1 Tax=Streptomyces sp. 6N223 TaxID=3457412 RepID=UPI003FD47D1E